MPMNNITKQIIASGANVVVRIGKASDSAEIEIGLASNVAFNENFQLQKANVVGYLGPLSIDPADYSCEITIGSFVPAKRNMNANDAPGGSQALSELVPTRATALDDGVKFQYLEFYNKKSDTVLAAFSGVVVASSGMNVDGNAYAKSNIQLWALERISLDAVGGAASEGFGASVVA
ncbi:MAG: hypothetical protein SAMD01599839_07820 [Rectinema sp.]